MAERIATWEYVDSLCGVSGKGHNQKYCPTYYNLMMTASNDADYDGLSISGTHTQTQLVTQNELSYTVPKRYFVYCTFRVSTTLQNVNAVWITNQPMSDPGTANTCPSFLNAGIGGLFGTFSGGSTYSFQLAGTVPSTGYETRPGSVQISNSTKTGLVSVSIGQTVYVTIKYNNYSQYFQTTGTLTTNLRSL